MKQYLLFAGQTYYPERGWKGWHGCHDSVEDAARVGDELLVTPVPPYSYSLTDWYQIVDSETGLIVVEKEK